MVVRKVYHGALTWKRTYMMVYSPKLCVQYPFFWSNTRQQHLIDLFDRMPLI